MLTFLDEALGLHTFSHHDEARLYEPIITLEYREKIHPKTSEPGEGVYRLGNTTDYSTMPNDTSSF